MFNEIIFVRTYFIYKTIRSSTLETVNFTKTTKIDARRISKIFQRFFYTVIDKNQCKIFVFYHPFLPLALLLRRKNP